MILLVLTLGWIGGEQTKRRGRKQVKITKHKKRQELSMSNKFFLCMWPHF